MKKSDDNRERLKALVLDKIDFSKELTDEDVKEIIDEIIVRESKSTYLSLEQRQILRKELFHAIRRLDILQELIENPQITEIMINGISEIFVEENGTIHPYGMGFSSEEKLEDVIQQIAAGCNRTVNEASPIVDARLENGARVNIVLKPVALNGPIVTIRRFPDNPIQMSHLIALGSLNQEVADFLSNIVTAGYNIFISGGTGSGKTTFLNVLSNFIPKEERIITIEDNAELQILHAPNLVRLETRNANMEGCQEISIRDLIKTSLRMRPNRIIVGEVRGGEAIDMMQCMNPGHDGSMSTGHANSAKDMLSRLETMMLMGIEIPLTAIRQQIAAGIDIIIHLGRLRDKSRRVLQIVEVIGYEKEEIVLWPIYQFEETGEDSTGKIQGRLMRKEMLKNDEKLKLSGLYS